MGSSYYTSPRDPLTRVPAAEQRDAHLADGEVVFGAMLEAFLGGLVAQAPAFQADAVS